MPLPYGPQGSPHARPTRKVDPGGDAVPRPRPRSQEDYDAVRRLHAEGKGRNEIATRMGRSTRFVSVLAAELGLSFDRTATEAATAARMADLAEKRAILAEALTDDALYLTEQLWQPTVVYNFGGKDNTYASRKVDEPPADAKRALMTAAGQAIDRSLRLAPPKDDDRSGEVGSLLTSLFDKLRDRHGDG
jgi:hypothetical protein